MGQATGDRLEIRDGEQDVGQPGQIRPDRIGAWGKKSKDGSAGHVGRPRKIGESSQSGGRENMIQKKPYICRFCGANHVVQYDDACPGLHIETMMKLLCCNRCADFRVANRDLTSIISGICRKVEVAKASTRGMNSGVDGECRTSLEKVTKLYATLMCNHLHLTNVWDSDFVNQLMDHPDKWPSVLRGYTNGLRSFKTIPPSRTHADP